MTLSLQNTLVGNHAPYKPSAVIKAYGAGSSTTTKSTSSDSVDIIPTDIKDVGTRTLTDTQEALDNGAYRRTRVFEQEDGRRFSRLEEVTFTQNTVRKTVVQQNPSGSITQYEEILDRQTNGSFRRTQRYTNESGETSTHISPDYNTQDSFVLTGGRLGFEASQNSFQTLRGTQLDLSA